VSKTRRLDDGRPTWKFVRVRPVSEPPLQLGLIVGGVVAGVVLIVIVVVLAIAMNKKVQGATTSIVARMSNVRWSPRLSSVMPVAESPAVYFFDEGTQDSRNMQRTSLDRLTPQMDTSRGIRWNL
jgi:hypothetical protein